MLSTNNWSWYVFYLLINYRYETYRAWTWTWRAYRWCNSCGCSCRYDRLGVWLPRSCPPAGCMSLLQSVNPFLWPRWSSYVVCLCEINGILSSTVGNNTSRVFEDNLHTLQDESIRRIKFSELAQIGQIHGIEYLDFWNSIIYAIIERFLKTI